MIIPLEHLSDEAIDNLVNEYCLRDWGLNDCESPLSARKQSVKLALETGKLVVLFSELHETATLISKDELQQAADNTST